MKPAWDKLMKEFANNKQVLVADVDCTAAGKDLCQTQGVQGYPTIKTGDPAALEDYQGGRDFAALKKHVESMKPSCSPFNIELCTDDQKKKITDLEALGKAELKTKIKDEEKKMTAAEENFKSEVEKLQKKYEALSKTKEADMAAIKEAGLGLMKAVAAKMDKEEL